VYTPIKVERIAFLVDEPGGSVTGVTPNRLPLSYKRIRSAYEAGAVFATVMANRMEIAESVDVIRGCRDLVDRLRP
jgi:hypothetical protein